MCDMCYGFIYDTIVNPYHKTDPLSEAFSLNKDEAHRISEKFLEVISEFMDLDFFEECDLPLDKCDEWTWETFKMENRDGHAKIIQMVKYLKEKKCVSEFLATRFFMNKLRILMMLLPQIHMEHTLKFYPKKCSVGPVPYDKLVEIRKKAGLSIPEYKENIEDLYG